MTALSNKEIARSILRVALHLTTRMLIGWVAANLLDYYMFLYLQRLGW